MTPWTTDAETITFSDLKEITDKLFGPTAVRRFVQVEDREDPGKLLDPPYILVGSKGSGKTLLLRCKEAALDTYEDELGLVFASYGVNKDRGGGRTTKLDKIVVPMKNSSAYSHKAQWGNLFYFIISSMALIRLARIELSETHGKESRKAEFIKRYLPEAGEPLKKAVGEVWDLYPEGARDDIMSPIISRFIEKYGDFRSFAAFSSGISMNHLSGDSKFVILIDAIDEAFTDENSINLVHWWHEEQEKKGEDESESEAAADESVVSKQAGSSKRASAAMRVWHAIQSGLADAVIRLSSRSGSRAVAFIAVRGDIKSGPKAESQLNSYTLNLEYNTDHLDAVFDSNVAFWMESEKIPASSDKEARMKAFFGDGATIANEKAIQRVLRHSLPFPRCVVEIGREISKLDKNKYQKDVYNAIEKGAKTSCTDHLRFVVPSFLPDIAGVDADEMKQERIREFLRMFDSNVIYRNDLGSMRTQMQMSAGNPFGFSGRDFETIIRLRQSGLIGIPTGNGGACVLDYYEDLSDGKLEEGAELVTTTQDKLLKAPYLVMHSALAAFLGGRERIKVDRRIKPGQGLPCPPQLFRPKISIAFEKKERGDIFRITFNDERSVATAAGVEAVHGNEKLAALVLICAAANCQDVVGKREVKKTMEEIWPGQKKMNFEEILGKKRKRKDSNDVIANSQVSQITRMFKANGLDFRVGRRKESQNDWSFLLHGIKAGQIMLEGETLEKLFRWGNVRVDVSLA